MKANPLSAITHRFLTFHGSIRAPASNSLRVALCSLVNEGATSITILISSGGGSTDDAMSLYTYLKALPVELTMHAVGFVSSVAIPVFLAAPKRVGSSNSRFMFHEYGWTHEQASTVSETTMREQALSLETALEWTKEIVDAVTNLKRNQFDALKLFDHPVIMSPADAARAGLISKVVEPSIPANSQPRVVL